MKDPYWDELLPLEIAGDIVVDLRIVRNGEVWGICQDGDVVWLSPEIAMLENDIFGFPMKDIKLYGLSTLNKFKKIRDSVPFSPRGAKSNFYKATSLIGNVSHISKNGNVMATFENGSKLCNLGKVGELFNTLFPHANGDRDVKQNLINIECPHCGKPFY